MLPTQVLNENIAPPQYSSLQILLVLETTQKSNMKIAFSASMSCLFNYFNLLNTTLLLIHSCGCQWDFMNRTYNQDIVCIVDKTPASQESKHSARS